MSNLTTTRITSISGTNKLSLLRSDDTDNVDIGIRSTRGLAAAGIFDLSEVRRLRDALNDALGERSVEDVVAAALQAAAPVVSDPHRITGDRSEWNHSALQRAAERGGVTARFTYHKPGHGIELREVEVAEVVSDRWGDSLVGGRDVNRDEYRQFRLDRITDFVELDS